MYDPIQGQGQGHGGPKVAKLADFSLSPPPRMYIYILLDTVLATDINKYSLASAKCQPIWRIHLANWI